MSVKILGTNKLTNEKWLNLYETVFEANGKEGKWTFASRRKEGQPSLKTNAVIVVPVLHSPASGELLSFAEGAEPKLVLIKEYRIPIQGYEYHFPAGLLEVGETIEECAKRELKEETGFDLLRIRRVSPILVSSAGLSDETSMMVFADCFPSNDGQSLEETEEIEVMLLTHEEMVQQTKTLPVFAAKTWPVLLMYEALGNFELPF